MKIVKGLPPSPSNRRTSEWKAELAEAFNQKGEEEKFGHELEVIRIDNIVSYPTEISLTVKHPAGLLGSDLIQLISEVRKLVLS